MLYETAKSKDSNLHIEREVTVNIRHLKLSGNTIGLNTEIRNRDEIAQEVEYVIRHCNDRELSREVAGEMCTAIMRSMIQESSAPESSVPLDLINEYLDVIFGDRKNAELYKVK